jgi:tetratricopeptide (TPR) repeat protein
VLQRSEDWSALADIYEDRIERCTDDEVAGDLGREALALLEFRLQDRARASKLAAQVCSRFPDHLPLLLDGIACMEAAKDNVEALTQAYESLVALSEGPLKTHALLRLGSLRSQQGKGMDAEEAFQQVAAKGTLAGVLKLYDVGAEQGESETTTSALLSLAETVSSANHRASLLEQAAWERTFALDDEGATDLFTQAHNVDPQRVGPVLGATLLAAKTGDRHLQAECLASLARVVDSSMARSSLLLRAGVIADVMGDEALAKQHFEASVNISPENSNTAVMSADRLPPLPPEAASIEELSSRAELYGIRSALAEPGPAQIDWQLERAEALEFAGSLREAALSVAEVLDQRPDDIRALQALRRICMRGGDRKNLARSSFALAKQIGDTDGRLQLLREAALIFDEELKDSRSAVAAYRLLLELDPGATEYYRLIALIQDFNDVRALYRCYSARLNYLDVQGESLAQADILLDRAQLRDGIGDHRGALRDLQALLNIDPEHSEALIHRARLLERSGDAEQAAEHYQRFLAIVSNLERRAPAELSLSYLLADSLDDLEGAIAQLQQVIAQSPTDLELRERLMALLLRAQRSDEAVATIREMCEMRSTTGAKARDEVRMAAVLRDANRLEEAVESLKRARNYDPLNMNAVRDLVELSGSEESAVSSLLERVSDDIRKELQTTPLRAGLYERLVTVAQWSEDGNLLRRSLQALKYAASLSAEQTRHLDGLRSPTPPAMKSMSVEQWQSTICTPEVGGFAGELWRLIGAAVSEVSGSVPSALGFERAHRQKPATVPHNYPQVAAMMEALGLSELDLFVSDARIGAARALSLDTPTLCLGSGLAEPSTPAERFALGRALAHARAGTGTAAALEDAELCLYFACAAQIAGVDELPGEWIFRVNEEAADSGTRELAKALGRKGRKELQTLTVRFQELVDPAEWMRAAQLSAARFGLLVSDSLPAAFEVMDIGRDGRPVADDKVAQSLMAWSVSGEHLALRKALGLEVAGG